MAINNNPLRQYFRRPSVYLKLPSGGQYYPPNVINQTETGELPATHRFCCIATSEERAADILANKDENYVAVESIGPKEFLNKWNLKIIK